MLKRHIDLAEAFGHCTGTISRVLFDLVELLRLAAKSRSALVAENLFLRKQLAMFQERNARPHDAQDSARWLMGRLSRLFDWRDALAVVKPHTLIRWGPVSRGFVSGQLAKKKKSSPLDPPAIAHFLRLGYWLISKVRVSSLEPSLRRRIGFCAQHQLGLELGRQDFQLFDRWRPRK